MFDSMQGLEPGAVFGAIGRAEEVFKGSGVARELAVSMSLGCVARLTGRGSRGIEDAVVRLSERHFGEMW